MTKIKLCGLRREEDILAANRLLPEYIGFIFARKSRRYVSPARAKELRTLLDDRIVAVGVFVGEGPRNVSRLLEEGIIGAAQLHGGEDEEAVDALRALAPGYPVIKAFRIDSAADVEKANASRADYVLLDSGAGGTGNLFDWSLLSAVTRPYFLAGGLAPGNVAEAVKTLRPYAVDVSSGIETDGVKDEGKMEAFVREARGG